MGGGTQVRVRASTGWFVVVGIFGWGRGGGGGGAASGSERAALLPSNPALSDEGGRQGGRRGLFFHTHTPPTALSPSLCLLPPPQTFCARRGPRQRPPAPSCQKHPATAANFVARAAGGAARGCRPSASSAPFRLPVLRPAAPRAAAVPPAASLPYRLQALLERERGKAAMRKKAGGRAERGQRDGGKWSVAQRRGEQTRVTSVCDTEPNRAKPCPGGAVEAQPPPRP
ncbi:uncharacterized protein LOC131573367 [Poecile atricapillus]|uniref:uncharacterized protein LOC131573367 n=1 Tax=Poecile atricapillus TaxID=48891 RepID=UPI002739FF8D|nr:uncharacterized protein LOC131573367 [Poecile atricapillus]